VAYSLVIDLRAVRDIQQAIDYYEEQQEGLGKKFESVLHIHMSSLQINPFYRIRYDTVRCLPLKIFPFMVHFTVEEKLKLITIYAVFHTSIDPDLWKKRK
jgi:toxin ParE1/3/4